MGRCQGRAILEKEKKAAYILSHTRKRKKAGREGGGTKKKGGKNAPHQLARVLDAGRQGERNWKGESRFVPLPVRRRSPRSGRKGSRGKKDKSIAPALGIE